MTDTNTTVQQELELEQEVTVQDLGAKLDMLGQQMNWLCENLAALFGFVNQMGASGGGIRGLMKAMKETPGLSEQTTGAGQ
jgi:hypothetical protein